MERHADSTQTDKTRTRWRWCKELRSANAVMTGPLRRENQSRLTNRWEKFSFGKTDEGEQSASLRFSSLSLSLSLFFTRSLATSAWVSVYTELLHCISQRYTTYRGAGGDSALCVCVCVRTEAVANQRECCREATQMVLQKKELYLEIIPLLFFPQHTHTLTHIHKEDNLTYTQDTHKT